MPKHDSANNDSAAPRALAQQLRTRFGNRVELDAIGEQLGASATSSAFVEALMRELAALGTEVVAPPRRPGPELLGLVLRAARELREQLGRPPTREEIASSANLSTTEVAHALEFSKVLAR
jgi:Sigma-70 region 3